MKVLCILLLPVILFQVFAFGVKYKGSRKSRLLYSVGFAVTGAVIGFLCSLIWKKNTIYELLLIEYECTCVLIYLAAVFREKIKMDVKVSLAVLCFMMMGIAGYSILTYGQTIIHSDTATAILLSQAQAKYGEFFPKSWYYVNGDIWVITPELFTFPFTMLLSNQSLARVLGALLSVLCISLGVLYFDKKVTKSAAWVIALPVIFVFMFGVYDLNLYQAAYSPQLLLTVLCLAFLYGGCIEKREKRDFMDIVLYALLAMLMGLAGIRQLAEVLLPLLGGYIIFEYFRNIETTPSRKEVLQLLRKIFLHLLVIALPMMIGYYLYGRLCLIRHVVMTDNNQMVFADSLDTCKNNLIAILVDMFTNFGYVGNVEPVNLIGIRNLISIMMCLIFIFLVPYLQYRRIKEEAEGVRFLFAFALVHNVEMLILGVFFGKVTPRYMLSFEYISILVSAHYIMKHWLSDKPKRVFYGMAFAAAGAFMCITLATASSGWTEKLVNKKRFTITLTEHGLDQYKGYATYWNAYANEVYSDLKISFAAVWISSDQQSISAQKWLVDGNRFEEEDKGSFLLLSAEENANLQPWLLSVYGEYEDSFQVDDKFVYVWDYDICVNKFKGKTNENSEE